MSNLHACQIYSDCAMQKEVTGTMIDITSDQHFKALFHRAFRIIDSVESFGAPKMPWTLGGGTALAMYFQHRMSHDLDIFLSDVQYLGFLTPRKNPAAEKETDIYDEQANYVKLHFGKYEIDFIVAPTLTNISPKKQEVFGRSIEIDSPAEILAKKIFYRASSLKGRDLFDIVNAVQKMPELYGQLAEFAVSRRDILEARLTLNHEQLQAEYNSFREMYGGPDFDTVTPTIQKLIRLHSRTTS
jgi:predicted nucleotidyltransferase component of viral defense system